MCASWVWFPGNVYTVSENIWQMHECKRHLFVHEHVDDGVVNSCGFGEERRNGRQPRVQVNVGKGRDHDGERGVRSPGHHEGHDHHHHHTSHLTLRLPGITQPAVHVGHLRTWENSRCHG